MSTMSKFVFIFLCAGLLFHVTTALSIPLSQDTKDAIEHYISEKQLVKVVYLPTMPNITTTEDGFSENMRVKDVETLRNRLTEMENIHAKDMQIITNRLTEVENMRAKDVQILTNRLTEVENMRATDVKILTNRLTEAENIHAKDVQMLTNRLTAVENMRAKYVQILTNCQTKDENIHEKDVQMLTNRHTAVKINRSKDGQIQNNHLSEVKSIRTKFVKDLTNHIADWKNNHPKDVQTQAKRVQTSRNLVQNLTKRTSPVMSPRVASGTDWVAFHATLHATIPKPGYGQVIAFSDMKTNLGTAYQSTSGVFTCKTPGVYIFSWSIRIGEPNHGLETELMRNGATVGYNTSGGGDGNVWGYGSATVTLYLQTGDEVWVRAAAGTPGIYIQTNSMFTGLLVHKSG